MKYIEYRGGNMKFNELVTGERYTTNFNYHEYELVHGGLVNVTNKSFSMLSMESIMQIEFKKADWKPGKGEIYYFADLPSRDGIEQMINYNTVINERMFKYTKVFKTELEAIEYRNKQDWWEND